MKLQVLLVVALVALLVVDFGAAEKAVRVGWRIVLYTDLVALVAVFKSTELSFLPPAQEASGQEAPRHHHHHGGARRGRGGGSG